MDYKKVKFKAGLEIHQQLDSHKLFCNCPSVLRKDEPNFEVKRKLHAVAGESGDVDAAAKFQSKLDKEFVYQGYDTTCLVELDEEPPHEINSEALQIAMHIGLLLNCEFVPISQVMRKTVLDGSNTGGFQRSVMIGHSGYLETSKGKVRIDALFLEEDACRVIERGEKKEVYRLDRLGIPLVEVVTAPDLVDAEHAKEVALMIGDVLRSCKVKRGLGTIRQDVSVSVYEGNRVELKGVQDILLLPTIVNNEVSRQTNLFDLSKLVTKFEVGKITNVTSIFNPQLEWMKKSILSGANFVAFKVAGFRGLFGREFFANYRLGTDLAKYSKVYGFGGIIHCDEDLTKYKFSKEEILALEKKLDVKEKDGWIMVLGKENLANKMIEEALIPRMQKLKNGVPAEVRNALEDGSTEFLRPMPGSARMYPETDVPLLKIGKELINEAKKSLPKLKSEMEEELRKQGLSIDIIKEIFATGKFYEYKALFDVFGNANLIGKLLFLYPKDIVVKENKSLEDLDEILTQDVYFFILEKVRDKELSEDRIKEALVRVVEGEDVKDAVVFEEINLDEDVMKLIKSKPGLSSNAYMGLIMQNFKGKISGKEAMDLINKFAKVK